MRKKNNQLTGWARVIYGFVALNAFIGALILLWLPAHTETLFFWTIEPPINARLFGALYLGGAAAVGLAPVPRPAIVPAADPSRPTTARCLL